MAQKKYLDLIGLQKFATSILSKFALKNHNHDTAYAAKSHTHTTAQVSGLDSALAGKAASSHTHTISNVTNLQTELDKKQVKIQPVTTSGTGAAYTATVPDITTLKAGVSFTMIPKNNPSGGKWGGKAFLCDIPRYVGSDPDNTATEKRIIKVIYVHDDCIKGSFQNASGDRNDVVLRAVYEY